MPTLRSLSEKLEVGDHIAWVAETAMDTVGERVHPKTVTNIDQHEDEIHVYAEGTRGGGYYYTVDSSGNSKGHFVNPNEDDPVPKGPIAFAQRVESDDLVPVKRGYYESQGEQDHFGH